MAVVTPPGTGPLRGTVPSGPKPIAKPKVIKPSHASTPHTTKTTTTKPAPPWLNSAALTQKQIDDQATSEANQSIAPEVSGLQGQQQTYDAQQKAYQAAMTGFYAALAPELAKVSGAQSAAYNSAATAMGDIAHGYAGALGAGAQQNADATTAALQRGGQDQAIGSAQAQANPGANGLTDPFAAQHGGIQGTSFAEEGAAKAADSANLPVQWAARGRDQLTEGINKAIAGDQGWADKISQVYAQVPALRATIVKQIQQAELDKQSLRDTEANNAFNHAAKVETLKQGQARIDQGNTRLGLTAQMDAFNQKYKIAGLQLQGQRLQLSAQKFAQETLQSDRSYAISLANLGIRQKSTQLKVIAQEYKLANGGFTPLQVQKFTGTATRLADNALNGVRLTDKYGNLIDRNGKAISASDTPVYKYPPLTYNQAIRESRKEGIPLSIAQAEFNKVYKPGKNGRPYTEQTAPPLYGPTMGQAGKANAIVNSASSFIGVPYVWGGTSTKGMDCSGFTQAAYARIGIKIPRTTYDQVKAGRGVNLNQLQPGDLVFTEPGKNGPNHVGMYIGNGQIQESPHTGDVNKVIPLKSFLSGGFVAARRYVG